VPGRDHQITTCQAFGQTGEDGVVNVRAWRAVWPAAVLEREAVSHRCGLTDENLLGPVSGTNSSAG
jgi:hypothetical protein